MNINLDLKNSLLFFNNYKNILKTKNKIISGAYFYES